MTTATEQFDVDRCVNEDNRMCRYIDSEGVTRDGVYLSIDTSPDRAVLREQRHSGKLISIHRNLLRNIQPKPRTVAVYVYAGEINGIPWASLSKMEDIPDRLLGTITINLDTCEQVEPDVMTAEQVIAKAGIEVGGPVEDHRGEYYVYRNNKGPKYLTPSSMEWKDHCCGGWWKSRELATAAAFYEATRILREGKHNA